MCMTHTAFRREFGFLRGVIRSVGEGDIGRAMIVTQHFDTIRSFLRHHQAAEDACLWPRVLARATASDAAVLLSMQAQHREIDAMLGGIAGGFQGWQDVAGLAGREALMGAASRLQEMLAEHLDAEEGQALPLIARHVTAGEWADMSAACSQGAPQGQLPLLFGMATYEASPEAVDDAIERMPAEVRPLVAHTAAEAYAAHARLVYGTRTPPGSAEVPDVWLGG
jgi:hemerythrin-like domain-containing protein